MTRKIVMTVIMIMFSGSLLYSQGHRPAGAGADNFYLQKSELTSAGWFSSSAFIEGELVNRNNLEILDLTIYFEVMDGKGYVIETISTSTSSLASGGKWRFSIDVSERAEKIKFRQLSVHWPAFGKIYYTSL